MRQAAQSERFRILVIWMPQRTWASFELGLSSCNLTGHDEKHAPPGPRKPRWSLVERTKHAPPGQESRSLAQTSLAILNEKNDSITPP